MIVGYRFISFLLLSLLVVNIYYFVDSGIWQQLKIEWQSKGVFENFKMIVGSLVVLGLFLGFIHGVWNAVKVINIILILLMIVFIFYPLSFEGVMFEPIESVFHDLLLFIFGIWFITYILWSGEDQGEV